MGSGAMFSDPYLEKEDNNKIKDVIFDYLTGTSTSAGGERMMMES